MRFDFSRFRLIWVTVLLFRLAQPAWAAIPAPEKLLPEDTVLMFTAPDFAKLQSGWQKLPQRQFWNDPAMKPFRDNFVSRWNERFVVPLERELDIKLDDYTNLLQGQLTFAVTRDGMD